MVPRLILVGRRCRARRLRPHRCPSAAPRTRPSGERAVCVRGAPVALAAALALAAGGLAATIAVAIVARLPVHLARAALFVHRRRAVRALLAALLPRYLERLQALQATNNSADSPGGANSRTSKLKATCPAHTL